MVTITSVKLVKLVELLYHGPGTPIQLLDVL
jgi:hypothetical protein